ncbi:TetR/AcrR family transcriptional regulator [Paraburkholderia sp. Se-20369]|nr:TetR/AcrR family transcriptional regulator [Paraburkholderia sp. Se-20369]
MSTEQRSSRNRRTSSAEAALVPPDGLRAQGVRTRNAIVRVARKCLLETGPLDFSLRAVALRVGISVSNLQYYFPTRLAVLRAVMASTIDAYLDELMKRTLNNGSPAREIPDVFLELGLSDAKDANLVTLWMHFVSFASTDPECSQMLGEWYDTVTRSLAQRIRVVNPECTEVDSLRVASFIIAMADGLSLQFRLGRHAQGIEAKFLATANFLVQGTSKKIKNTQQEHGSSDHKMQTSTQSFCSASCMKTRPMFGNT